MPYCVLPLPAFLSISGHLTPYGSCNCLFICVSPAESPVLQGPHCLPGCLTSIGQWINSQLKLHFAFPNSSHYSGLTPQIFITAFHIRSKNLHKMPWMKQVLCIRAAASASLVNSEPEVRSPSWELLYLLSSNGITPYCLQREMQMACT